MNHVVGMDPQYPTAFFSNLQDKKAFEENLNQAPKREQMYPSVYPSEFISAITSLLDDKHPKHPENIKK